MTKKFFKLHVPNWKKMMKNEISLKPNIIFLIAAEQYLAETKRRKRAVGDEFYENFFALHGEYPKAFVSGPGIYGVGVQGISTVYDVRSSPFGSIG